MLFLVFLANLANLAVLDNLVLLDFPNQCQSVSERQNHFFHTFVVLHVIIKRYDALCLLVAGVGWIDNMLVPQRVVGKDETA